MVELRGSEMELIPINSCCSIPDDRDRCLSERLGCLLQGCPIGGSLVQKETGETHQHTRTPCSHLGSDELCQEQEVNRDHNKNRQLHSNGIYQPPRRDSLQCVDQDSVWLVNIWAIERNIFLTAEHLPRLRDTIAD